jgi:asparagine synthase (glutamine-hydrolysing)
VANFVFCLDTNDDRRRRFLEAAKPRLPLFPGLRTGVCSAPGFDGAWAVGAHAPVGCESDEKGAAILFGEAIDGQGHRLAASSLRRRWNVGAMEQLRADFDGYYAACTYVPNERLIAGADLLGMFPLYYYASAETLLIGSSPETFRYHPVFRTVFNPPGLIGIMLTNGLFDGETLLRGVRRLQPGHVLVWEPGTTVREVLYYQVPMSNRYNDLSFASHLDILDGGMQEATARHIPGGRSYSLLLSGGLDSRTVAGYMNQAGRDAVALTLGSPRDLEVQCARAVAKTLGLRHHVRELDISRYVDYAHLQATWEQGASGFSLIMQWGVQELLADLPPAAVSGLGLDWVLGGHAPTHRQLAFDSFFRYQNAWGLEPHRLERLVRSDVFGDLVPSTMKRIEDTYTAYADSEPARSWNFSLRHRQRFHIGSEAWRLSFAAWPILPAADKTLLELGAALPPATMADRRAQYELLCTRFPHLAALPLDRNSYDVTPLRPRLRWLLANQLRRPLRRLKRTFLGTVQQGRERRRYYRIFDINGPGWVAVRREAEKCRDLAHGFFERDALAELLPPPDVPIAYRDGIQDVAGIKTVVGFMLWARDHLQS